MNEKYPTSFRLSRKSKHIVKTIAKDYGVSMTDVVEMILAGKISVPDVLKELREDLEKFKNDE